MKSFVFDETKKAVLWFRSVLNAIARWMFGMLIRMALVLAVLFFLGGGYSFLKSHFWNKEKTSPSAPALENHSEEGHQTSETPYPQETDFGGSVAFERRIRSGQSQVRSWEYRFRALKRDIERLFRGA